MTSGGTQSATWSTICGGKRPQLALMATGRSPVCPSLICNAAIEGHKVTKPSRPDGREKAVLPSIGRADQMRPLAFSCSPTQAQASTHTHQLIIRHAAALICGPHLISLLVSALLYDLRLTHAHTHAEPGGCSTAHFNLPACSLKYTQEKITAGGETGRMAENRISLRLKGTNSSIFI